MNMRTPRPAAAAALAASVLAIVPAASQARPWNPDRKVVIAVEAPMSGQGREDGLDQLRGVELAARQANAEGGILGREILVIRADDQGMPDLALPTFRRVARARADAVIGPYNSSVGVINLPWYLRARIVPVQMASTDATSGMGVNVQPKTRQISPVEVAYVRRAWRPNRVAILAGSSTFLAGEADGMQRSLEKTGVAVTRLPVAAGVTDCAPLVAEVLAQSPDGIYISTKINEGACITRALISSGSTVPCLLGFANTDPSFVARAGIPTSQRCVFSGVPLPQAFPTARQYVRDYQRAFGMQPLTWGSFTYDSAGILFAAMRRAGTTAYRPVMRELKATRGYRGATGTITIDPRTGDRREVAVKILRVDDSGGFAIAG
jgi:branched-chain amino acid transport system substrate-binding protein